MPLTAGSRRLVLSALALFGAAAVLGELVLRICDFRYAPLAERDVIWSRERDGQLAAPGLYQRDAREIWKPVAGAELPWAKGERLNSAGFRGEDVPPGRRPGVLRIAVLGSGEALGVGLPRERCWPFLLRAAIEQHGLQAEILCAAVEDSTIAQGLERWRAEVRTYRPDLVLCTFAGEMESRAAPCGCTDAQRIADNCGHGFPDYRERPQPLPEFVREARLVQSGLWLFDVLDGDYWSRRASELEAQRIARAPDVLETGGTRRVPLEDLPGLIGQLDQEVRREDARLILFPIVGERLLRGKSSAVGAYHARLIEIARELKISRFSAWELFKGQIDSGTRVEELFSEGQLSERGQRLLGHQLAKVLLPRLKELQR